MRVDSTNAVFPKETENSDVASNREKMVEDLGRALEKTRETVAKEREDIMTRHHEIVRKGQEANRKKLLEEKREQELLEDAQTRRERFEAQRENAVRENDVLATTREADAVDRKSVV